MVFSIKHSGRPLISISLINAFIREDHQPTHQLISFLLDYTILCKVSEFKISVSRRIHNSDNKNTFKYNEFLYFIMMNVPLPKSDISQFLIADLTLADELYSWLC